MLCQLVCLDRRYQRMNCFNIREIQALLKGRFFTDLVNSHDHHLFLNKTVIGLRFKTDNLDSINPNMLLFYRYGINGTSDNRTVSYLLTNNTSENNYNFINSNTLFYQIIELLNSYTLNYFTRYITMVYFFVCNFSTATAHNVKITNLHSI